MKALVGRKPRRGGSSNLSPLWARGIVVARCQGLAPLAIGCRRFAAAVLPPNNRDAHTRAKKRRARRRELELARVVDQQDVAEGPGSRDRSRGFPVQGREHGVASPDVRGIGRGWRFWKSSELLTKGIMRRSAQPAGAEPPTCRRTGDALWLGPPPSSGRPFAPFPFSTCCDLRAEAEPRNPCRQRRYRRPAPP